MHGIRCFYHPQNRKRRYSLMGAQLTEPEFLNDRFMNSKSPNAVKMCALWMVPCSFHLMPAQPVVYVHISTLFLSVHRTPVRLTLP